MDATERQLIEIFRQLDSGDRSTLVAFAGFLAQRGSAVPAALAQAVPSRMSRPSRPLPRRSTVSPEAGHECTHRGESVGSASWSSPSEAVGAE